MIAEAVNKREEEQEKSDAFKQDIVSDLRGMIESQIAAVLANGGGAKKPLQRGVARSNASSADAGAGKEAEDIAERCAASLMDKFMAMGSKANMTRSRAIEGQHWLLVDYRHQLTRGPGPRPICTPSE